MTIKKLSVVLLLALLLATFAACGTTSKQPVPKVINAAALFEGAQDNAAYKSAVEGGYFISSLGEPVTDYAAVQWFITQVEQGKDAQLVMCNLVGGPMLDEAHYYAVKFTLQDGKLYADAKYSAASEKIVFDGDKYDAEIIELNEYGYFVYHVGENSENSSFKVIQDSAIFENDAQNKQMLEKYITPLSYSALGNNDWSSINELRMLWVYEDLCNRVEGFDPFDKYGVRWPVDDIMAVLNKYFYNASEQKLIAGNTAIYKSEDKVLEYYGGRGGGPVMRRVLSSQQQGNMLAIQYCTYDHVTGRPYEDAVNILTVEVFEDGSFKYISNSHVESLAKT